MFFYVFCTHNLNVFSTYSKSIMFSTKKITCDFFAIKPKFGKLFA